MVRHSASRRLVALLAVGLVVSWTVASPVGALSIRDPNFNGVWQDWGGGWKYVYFSATDTAYWNVNGKDRLAYQYSGGQWWDCDKFNAWRTMGASGVSDQWIGDGGMHNLNNGWSYMYVSSWDQAYWRDNGRDRFSYQYGAGQWFDFGTDWYRIGATNVSSSFLGDGGWHSLNNEWSYMYVNSWDQAYWRDSGRDRFSYQYGAGQWFDFGTAWYRIGATKVSSSFLGDGGWHSLNNGWSYDYGAGVDQGSWIYNGRLRLVYSYGPGQWYDPTTPTWSALGIAGLSSAFLGDGAWHDLNDGWSWVYSASGDECQWMYGTNVLYKYSYIPGQWYGYSPTTATWSTYGAGNVSAALIGDGAWHDLNDGWSYLYNDVENYGEWRHGANSRFRYAYASGQWYDFATNPGVWSTVGAAGHPARFLGDGNTHNIYNNGSWIFTYDVAQDRAYWQDQTVQRFAFDYLNGQWFDNGAFTLGWTPLGGANVASLFIGDGGWHGLNNGWEFIYGAGEGRWRDASGERFKYAYASGQWSDLDAGSVWTLLGGSGLNSQFIGDGTYYDLGLGGGWQYRYAAANGYYFTGTADRFSYDYGTGAWTDYAPTGAYQLGANLRSSTFIGDGLSHDLGTGWFYTYLADEGYWSRTSGGPSRLSYLYSTGQWYDWDKFSNKFALGATGALASSFMGDEAWHDVTLPLGNAWWYQYNALNDEDRWAKTDGGPVKFAYGYAAGDWYDNAPIGGTYLLGTGMTAAFIGDEAVHDLLNNWHYAYAYGANEGNWSTLLSGQTRFSYNYDGGQWYQHYLANRYALGALGTAGQFIGDGNVYDLGAWSGVSGNWWYQYAADTDTGSWSKGQLDPVRFAYAYGPGQWSGGNAAGSFALGNAGLSPVFIGDGAAHDITTGANAWWYTYTYATDTGSWSKSDIAPYRFAYDYTNSQWTDNAPIGGPYALGNAGLNASFIGDGNAHALNTTWEYTYDYLANEAAWLNTALALNIYSYNYDAGQWYHHDGANRYALGNTGQMASSFIGDGAWHDVTTGPNAWWYKFDGAQTGQFAQADAGTVRFGYDYASSLWRTYGFGGSALQLGTLKLDTWVGDENPHDMGTGWRFTYAYGTAGDDEAVFDNLGYHTEFSYQYLPGQWKHSYNSIFSRLGEAGNAISNSYYDGGIHAITIGGLAEQYQFAAGDIGGALDREVGYYYGATGTSVVGPNLAYSYYANGAADGTWALIQRSGTGVTTYLTFTEAGLAPDVVNFADGVYHTTFTGQWAKAKFDPTGFGKVYFELSSQDATVPTEHIYYDVNLNQWYDQWNSNGSWYTMVGGMWYGSGNKFMATNLASGSTFAFAQPTAPANYLNMWFGDQVTYTHWPNMETYAPIVLNHIIYETGRGVYDYTNYQVRNPINTPTNPAAAWYLNFSNKAPNFYYAR